MDNSNYSKNKHNQHLGVNKIGKNITKNPFHHANFGNQARQSSHPQVYNINKNQFRNMVQQLTGSPSPLGNSQEPLLRTPLNPSMRLQRIRPPPLAHSQTGLLPSPADHRSAATTMDSPGSSYMQDLQRSIMDPAQGQQQSSGLLPNPSVLPFPPPRMGGPPPLLPSPNSKFLFPSPRSPYPPLSPGFRHTPPLTPNLLSSPLSQLGILGPGPQSLPVSSPRWRG